MKTLDPDRLDEVRGLANEYLLTHEEKSGKLRTRRNEIIAAVAAMTQVEVLYFAQQFVSQLDHALIGDSLVVLTNRVADYTEKFHNA